MVNVINFQKNSSFQLMQTLQWCLSASFLKVGCKVVSLNGVSLILLISRQLWYLLRVCSTWQKPCSGKYVVGNPVILASLFPKVEMFRDGGIAFSMLVITFCAV